LIKVLMNLLNFLIFVVNPLPFYFYQLLIPPSPASQML
jgi:hypothetical protein